MRKVAGLPSPLGRILASFDRPNGMRIEKVSVPFGVIGIIYEARPNVTFDVFSLCLKSGNVCILKGGSDAQYSNNAIINIINKVLISYGIDSNTVTLLPNGHSFTDKLLTAVGQVDLIIPRGSGRLINYVREHALVPVIETGAGICHTYFDSDGDLEKGRNIVFNAKTRRVSVCNALDCLIIHKERLSDLVGPSGSGKSTVANLIPRFWDVEQGEICIGGIDIRQIDTAKLMDMVSFVFQDNFLFYDTLYENIAVGSPDATKEKVIAAAKAAQCHDFIERLPQGYETRIGDKGVFLSGGEAQRICVARAILKNAPILVLDEATAFADPENEHKMQMALQSLIKDKTVIVIAHRLSSIISAHQIVVMKEGRIVQCGKHEQLSVTEGVYKNMWDAYTSAYHWTLNKN